MLYILSCFNNAYNLYYNIHTYIEYILIKLTYYYPFCSPTIPIDLFPLPYQFPFYFMSTACVHVCMYTYAPCMSIIRITYRSVCVRIIYRNRGLSFISVVNRHRDQGNFIDDLEFQRIRMESMTIIMAGSMQQRRQAWSWGSS